MAQQLQQSINENCPMLAVFRIHGYRSLPMIYHAPSGRFEIPSLPRKSNLPSNNIACKRRQIGEKLEKKNPDKNRVWTFKNLFRLVTYTMSNGTRDHVTSGKLTHGASNMRVVTDRPKTINQSKTGRKICYRRCYMDIAIMLKYVVHLGYKKVS